MCYFDVKYHSRNYVCITVSFNATISRTSSRCLVKHFRNLSHAFGDETDPILFLQTGAGLSSVVISFLMSTYHNVIIAYAIYYFFAAFRAKQPWSDCDNSWNSLACWLPTYGVIDNRTRPNASRTPSEEFFE